MKLIEDVKVARNRGVPLLAIETYDQPALLQRLVEGVNGAPQLVWNCQDGLGHLNDDGRQVLAGIGADLLRGSARLSVALLALRGVDPKTVTYLLGVHAFLGGHTLDPVVVQGIANLREPYKGSRRTLILLGPSFAAMPPELQADVVVLREEVPTDEQLAGVITELHAGNEMPLDPKALPSMVSAVKGLPALFTVEQVVAMSFRRGAVDMDALWERKRSAINANKGLRLSRPSMTFADLAGMDSIMEFFRRYQAGPRPFKVVLFWDEIEKMMAGSSGEATDSSGVSSDFLSVCLKRMEEMAWAGAILLGVPGSGKTAIAQATCGEFRVPMIEMDFGAMKGRYVGDSESAVRAAFDVTEGLGGEDVLVVATCVAGDTLVATPSGALLPIKESLGHRLASVHADASLFSEAPSAHLSKMVTDGLTVRISSAEIDCTRDHHFLRFAPDGLEEVRADMLRPGDFLPCPRMAFHGVREIDADLAYLVGYLVGDGNVDTHYGRSRLQWSEHSKEHADYIAGLCGKVFGKRAGVHRRSTSDSYMIYLDNSEATSTIKEHFPEACIAGSTRKRVPRAIMEAADSGVGAFLSGLFDADGTVAGGRPAMATASKVLAHQVVLLLRRLGIMATLHRRAKTPNDAWQITIGSNEGIAFAGIIGFRMKAKQGLLLKHPTARSNRCFSLRTVPVPLRGKGSMHRETKVEAERRPKRSLWALRYDWQRVKEVIPKKDMLEVYDLTMPTEHNYVASGVIVHNCNRLRSLPPEFRRRFWLGNWYYDVPSPAEQAPIKRLYEAKYAVAGDWPDTASWTGAEIRNAARLAHRLGCSLVDAGRYVVPIAKADPESLETLRQIADGRFLSASYPGPWVRDGRQTAGKSRRQIGE